MNCFLVYRFENVDAPETVVVPCENRAAALYAAASVVADNVLDYDDLPDHKTEIKHLLTNGDLEAAVELYCKHANNVELRIEEVDGMATEPFMHQRFSSVMQSLS